MKTIVVAVDASEYARRAFEKALEWKKPGDKVILFHVIQEAFDPYFDELEEQAAKELELKYQVLCQERNVHVISCL
jgi:nucleotide-binding universal stress UspA family protein